MKYKKRFKSKSFKVKKKREFSRTSVPKNPVVPLMRGGIKLT
ncbi:MAG: hypothetical protein ACRC1P_05570 [Cellulosilyticaceae bacterium]